MTLSLLEEARSGIVDPQTGEVIDRTNVDQLAEVYARLDIIVREYSETLKAIRLALGDLSYGDARTRRVRGDHHRVRLEFPPSNWNQSKLREAWERYNEIAQDFIKISAFAPKLREVKKIQNESGPTDFLAFRKLLLEAEEPSTSPPRVYLESDTATEIAEQEWTVRAALKASLEVED